MRRTDLQSHPDAVARVEPRTAHLRQFPARPQIARPPFGIGFEATRGEHDGGTAQLVHLSVSTHANAHDTIVFRAQGQRPGRISALYPENMSYLDLPLAVPFYPAPSPT